MEFNTKEEAEQYIESIRSNFLSEGKTIVSDNSYAYKGRLYSLNGETDDKWRVWMSILTQEMVDDIKNMKPFDIQELEYDYIMKYKRELRKNKLRRILG